MKGENNTVCNRLSGSKSWELGDGRGIEVRVQEGVGEVRASTGMLYWSLPKRLPPQLIKNVQRAPCYGSLGSGTPPLQKL